MGNAVQPACEEMASPSPHRSFGKSTSKQARLPGGRNLRARPVSAQAQEGTQDDSVTVSARRAGGAGGWDGSVGNRV